MEQYWPVELLQLREVATDSMSIGMRILLPFPK